MPEDQSLSETPDAVISDNNQEKQTQNLDPVISDNKNTVAYDTHRKLLGEKKRLQDQFNEAQAKLTNHEEEKMQSEGQKDELIDSLRKRLDESEQKYSGAVGEFAHKSINSQVEAEALKMGCVDVNLLIKSVQEKFSELQINDGFKVNGSDIKNLLEKAKEETPILFSKAAPKIIDGVPRDSNFQQGNDLGALNIDQLSEMLAKKTRQSSK